MNQQLSPLLAASITADYDGRFSTDRYRIARGLSSSAKARGELERLAAPDPAFGFAAVKRRGALWTITPEHFAEFLAHEVAPDDGPRLTDEEAAAIFKDFSDS